MNEIQIYRGRLAEKELAAKKHVIVIRGLINQLRIVLDPVADPESIDSDDFFALAMELAGKLTDYKGLVHEIGVIKKVLGE